MVGDGDIANAFYAGNYAAVLAATVDAKTATTADDLAFAVGALCFVGRVEEAEAVYDGWLARGLSDVRTLVACHFFLGLASARGGHFARSHAWLVTKNVALRHAADAWARALVFQGLACQRYFTGRLEAAERNALRALRAGHEAQFAYAVMLATDLRGHALIQLGRLERGTAVLSQNRQQANKLGLTQNVFAIDCAIATYAAAFRPTTESLARLDVLLKKKAHDSYSQRALLNERAVLLAMRGERRAALEALALSDAQALRGDTRRAKVGNLLARLRVMRFTHGLDALRPLVAQALALTDASELAFRAKALAFFVLCSGDRAAEEELRALAAKSDSYVAAAALAELVPGGDQLDPFAEDQLTPILRGVHHRDERVIERVLELGLFGLLPEVFGLTPGERVIVLGRQDLVIVEGAEGIVVQRHPPRWVFALLSILASGEASKERLAARLWGRHEYHPLRHDPPVRTTIHRLRTFLSPYGGFVRMGEGGYELAVPLQVIGSAPVSQQREAPLWEQDEAPSLTSAAPRNEPRRRSHEDVVLEKLSELEHATVTELALALDTSVSTVLRTLRQLVAARRVKRTGKARATRYWPRRGLTSPG